MEDSIDRPVSEDVLVRGPDAGWSLRGYRCGTCDEVGTPASSWCGNCGGTSLEEIELDRRGTLWSYTVIRHRPPGDLKLPEPYRPMPVGMVELNGVRVLAPLDVALEHIEIGMELELETFHLVDESADTPLVAFRFREVVKTEES
ncbi:MAG: Zn-ribbon domain-containing OB-fold protein [Acidimicrobiales bacterium]